MKDDGRRTTTKERRTQNERRSFAEGFGGQGDRARTEVDMKATARHNVSGMLYQVEDAR